MSKAALVRFAEEVIHLDVFYGHKDVVVAELARKAKNALDEEEDDRV